MNNIQEELPWDSPYYCLIDYQFRYSLSAKPEYDILNIHSVIVDNKQIDLEKKHENTLWAYAWKMLDSRQYPDIINDFKMNIRKDGVSRAYVGGIPNTLVNNDDFFYLGLFKMYIGNSFSYKGEPKSNEPVNSKNYPNYYNSIKYLSETNMCITVSKKETDLTLQSFLYEVFNSDDLFPLYVIKVGKKAQNEDNKARYDNYYCSKCHGKEAEIFCHICEAYFDKECWTKIHPSKNNQPLHEKGEKVLYKQKQGPCRHKKDATAEFYCLTCKEPICSLCRIMIKRQETNHSEHKCLDIHAAYEKELPKFTLADEIRKRAVEHYAKVKETIKLLIEKHVKIEKEIDYEFSEENSHIQSIIKEAKMKNFSIHAELDELKEHLKTMNDYFQTEESLMRKVKLIPQALWIKDNYTEIINDMFANFPNIDTNYNVTPESFNDIKRTEMRLTKQIQARDGYQVGGGDEYPLFVSDNKLFEKDYQAAFTKILVSMKPSKKIYRDRKLAEKNQIHKTEYKDAPKEKQRNVDEKVTLEIALKAHELAMEKRELKLKETERMNWLENEEKKLKEKKRKQLEKDILKKKNLEASKIAKKQTMPDKDF